MLIATTLASPSLARTWRVEKDGSGDFTVIQDAVDAAASDDTLRLGPGRFSDYGDYTLPGGIWHLYAYAQRGPLTMIGVGEGMTFIGPDNPSTWTEQDLVIGLLYSPPGSAGALHISSLTFSDSIKGAYIQSGGVAAEHCVFERLTWGLFAGAAGTVRDCQFDAVRDVGIVGVSSASSVLVDYCVFTNSLTPFNLQLIASAVVQNCEISSCGSGGIFDRSAGSMRNCTLQMHGFSERACGLEVWGPGTYTITDNSIDGGCFNIVFGMGASNVTGERNILFGSRDSAIQMASCTPMIRNNDILRGAGIAVRLDGYIQPPDLTVDMSNNYWGTTEADSISAWITDGHDVTEPPLHGFVNYEPFASTSVPTQKVKFGDLKAMFRGSGN
jgi:hypothetical protein